MLKVHIADFSEVSDDTLTLALLRAINTLIKEHRLVGKGYRIVVNGGGAAQVAHLHYHLMGPITKTRKM